MNRGRTRLSKLAATALSAALLLAGAGGVAYLCAPLEVWTPPPVNLEPSRDTAEQRTPAPKLSELAVIWQRDLRQPVVDLPPTEPQKPKDEPKLAVQLIGTVIEQERQYGVFQFANDQTVVRPAGAEVDGYAIIEIDRGRARLRYRGREYDLRVPWYDRIAATRQE